ncbi:hypothetical protein [Sulfurimonas sp. HSL3-7]|uniref:hypothetical protein n=1 Tax=Sulfonitrofixus jiaomeiensis TaxID=3131938 RepID=UPI0031FA2599
MHKYKEFILIFFLFLFLGALLLPVTNLWIDRYRIFNAFNHHYDTYYWRKDNKWEFNHADRIIPMAFLLSNKHEFDSFIFGNSKIGNMDVRSLGASWYKLNYNSGNMVEHLHNAKLLLDNIHVKNIILTIDLEYFYDLSINVKYKKDVYPKDMGEWAVLLKKYLFKREDEKDFNFLFEKDYELIKKEEFYIRTNANHLVPYDKNAEHLSYVNNLTGLRYKDSTFDQKKIDQVIGMIRELKTLTEIKGAHFSMLFVPFHYKNIFQADPDKINYIKRELVSISDFYDFSLPHNYIINNAFWRETFHYTKAVNDEIIKKIKNEKQLCEPFGVLLTKNNIDTQLETGYNTSRGLIDYLLISDSHFFPHKNFRNGVENSDIFSTNLHQITQNCLDYY